MIKFTGIIRNQWRETSEKTESSWKMTLVFLGTTFKLQHSRFKIQLSSISKIQQQLFHWKEPKTKKSNLISCRDWFWPISMSPCWQVANGSHSSFQRKMKSHNVSDLTGSSSVRCKVLEIVASNKHTAND